MTEFDLMSDVFDGRFFVKIKTETVHTVVRLDHDELNELRDRLDEPPTPVDIDD